MADQPIRFNDGAAYEEYMGVWSRSAGLVFLEWLAPPAGQRWLDVGCGNGAFTELILERCAPAEVRGIDPSEGQLAFARTRFAGRPVHVQQGDAMALPFPAESFDIAVMALVLVFVPEPAKALGEMVRVVRPGGTITAYMWDMMGGGFPFEPIQAEMRALDIRPSSPPQIEASRPDTMRDLWAGAGLVDVEIRGIEVERKFADFEEFWAIALKSPTLAPTLAGMDPAVARDLKSRVRTRLALNAVGPITLNARAHAIRGFRPA